MTRPERIILEGRKARLDGSNGQGLSADLGSFVQTINRNSVVGRNHDRLPHNVCWKVDAGPLSICIVELEPQLRRLIWIDEATTDFPLGPEASYQPRRLATPYVVLKVPFLKGRIVPRAELFYRNEPLRYITDPLYWPNLLNVSPNAYGCKAWICTQYLESERTQPGIVEGLEALLNHLWGGGFNRSSELHEGMSGFSKAKADELDPRVTDLDLWEKESIKAPRFVLTISWKPVGMTVDELIDEELRRHRVCRDLGTTGELANLLVTHSAKSSRGARRGKGS